MPHNPRKERQSIRFKSADLTDKNHPECQPHRHYLGEYRPSIALLSLNIQVPSKLHNVAPQIETIQIPVCRQCYYVSSLLAMLQGAPTSVIPQKAGIEPKLTKLDA